MLDVRAARGRHELQRHLVGAVSFSTRRSTLFIVDRVVVEAAVPFRFRCSPRSPVVGDQTTVSVRVVTRPVDDRTGAVRRMSPSTEISRPRSAVSRRSSSAW